MLKLNNLTYQYAEVTQQIIELEEQIKELTSVRQELIEKGLPSVFECRTGHHTYKNEYDYDNFKYIVCMKTKPPIKAVAEDYEGNVYATIVYQDGSKEVIEHNDNGFIGWGDTEKEAWKKASQNLYYHDQVNKYLGWSLD
ncbi:MAG: hypothetical protein ACKPFF_11080 [Planktothrix sp.]